MFDLGQAPHVTAKEVCLASFYVFLYLRFERKASGEYSFRTQTFYESHFHDFTADILIEIEYVGLKNGFLFTPAVGDSQITDTLAEQFSIERI